ncbi:hypothetical protein GCM10010954_27750 [Halobacillus andaensis]|uniref:Uncharacterized protein n=1 Tax=Halobacillus andaensis TaxID=1176239 RepID=A0A917EZI6_HALAA|nr:hypothetical protein GCM10010954_27750 [Halobacillus andaensis]
MANIDTSTSGASREEREPKIHFSQVNFLTKLAEAVPAASIHRLAIREINYKL